MTNAQMLDDVNLAIEIAHVTAATKAIAGYVNGRWNNWPAIVQKWSRTGLHLVSIDVQGNPTAGAQALDVEKGDVDPANYAAIIAWVRATRAAGLAARDLRWFPKVYTSVSNAKAIVEKLTAAGIPRSDYRLWTAHYTGVAHICDSACGFGDVQADATQWTSTFQGASLDASLCAPAFFDGPAVPVIPVPPKPPVVLPPPVAKVAVPDVIGKRNTDAVKELEALGLKAGSEASAAGVVNSQTPAPGAEADKGSVVDLGVKADPVVVPPKPPVVVPPPPPVAEPPVIEEPKPEPALAETLFAERVLQIPATLTRVGDKDIQLPAGTVLYIPLKNGA